MKTYFRVLRTCFRQLLFRIGELPTRRYSPFYARWETALFEERRYLRKQAQKARQAREAGLEQGFLGWVAPEEQKRSAR